jgi:hypothetical protein
MSGEIALFDAGGRTAIVAAATLDGIAGAAIWAGRRAPVKTLLFAPEGQTGPAFAAPALAAPDVARLYGLGLPLIAGDLPAVATAFGRAGLAETVWLDHHYIHAEHAAELRRRGAHVVNDPARDDSTDLLLWYLGRPQDWELALAQALRDDPENAPEPWRSWMYVFLATQSEPFAIRRAIQPLTEQRFEAYDPALREAGETRWREVREFAAGAIHETAVGDRRLAIVGLPPSAQNDYRLLADAVLRRRGVDLALVFFDGVPRLALRRLPVAAPGDDFPALADLPLAPGGRAYLYDRNTLFLETSAAGPLADLGHVVDALRAHFAETQP